MEKIVQSTKIATQLLYCTTILHVLKAMIKTTGFEKNDSDRKFGDNLIAYEKKV